MARPGRICRYRGVILSIAGEVAYRCLLVGSSHHLARSDHLLVGSGEEAVPAMGMRRVKATLHARSCGEEWQRLRWRCAWSHLSSRIRRSRGREERRRPAPEGWRPTPDGRRPMPQWMWWPIAALSRRGGGAPLLRCAGGKEAGPPPHRIKPSWGRRRPAPARGEATANHYAVLEGGGGGGRIGGVLEGRRR